MRIERPVVRARLVRRYKRFLADCVTEAGEELTAHCPNTGSLLGCQEPGSAVVLRDSQDPARKLRWTFQTVEVDGTWVNVDTALPNAVVAEALEAGAVPELAGYASLRREVRSGDGNRIDLLLEDGPTARCWVEVKCTTLAAGGTARFPDAVTERGRKHLVELARLAAAGDRAVIFFFVSRGDVERFAPADDIDPAYGRALRAAVAAGVEALAWRTRVEPGRLELAAPLPIDLGGGPG